MLTMDSDGCMPVAGTRSTRDRLVGETVNMEAQEYLGTLQLSQGVATSSGQSNYVRCCGDGGLVPSQVRIPHLVGFHVC